MQLAEELIKRPGSQGPSGQGVEREAGYILLGALCASGLPKAQKVLHTPVWIHTTAYLDHCLDLSAL